MRVLRVPRAGWPHAAVAGLCLPLPGPGDRWRGRPCRAVPSRAEPDRAVPSRGRAGPRPCTSRSPVPNLFGAETGALVGVHASPERCSTAWAPAPGTDGRAEARGDAAVWGAVPAGGLGAVPTAGEDAGSLAPGLPARQPRPGCQRGEVELGAAARTGLAGPEEVSGLGRRHAPLPAPAGATLTHRGSARQSSARLSLAHFGPVWLSPTQLHRPQSGSAGTSQCHQALSGDVGAPERVSCGTWRRWGGDSRLSCRGLRSLPGSRSCPPASALQWGLMDGDAPTLGSRVGLGRTPVGCGGLGAGGAVLSHAAAR